jgi:hypothetical protein
MAQVTSAAVDTVSAGAAQTITLPTSTVTLTGTATASSGSTIAGYAWTVKSAPVGVTPVLATPTAVSTSVTGLTVAGSYVFTLTASDNTTGTALTKAADVTVTVNASTVPVPPVKTFKSKLEINPNGRVNLQGELMSVGTGTMSVKVWGITFTVNTTNAQWNGKVLDVTGYKVGDTVSVTGKLDTAATTPTIIARNVKDMTAQALKERDEKLLKVQRLLEAKNKKGEDKGKGDDDR